MSIRKDILDQLHIDLKDKFNSNNGYKSDPVDIIHGIIDFDGVNQYPIVGFNLLTDEIISETLGAFRERVLNIIIYGGVELNYDDLTNLYDLIEDLENFLITGWTNSNLTNLGSVEIYVGGSEKTRGFFSLEAKIYYTQTV